MGEFSVHGTVLKLFGLIVLVGGFVGMLVGAGLFVTGQMEINDSDDQGLVSDSGRRETGETARSVGGSVFGSSLMAAGLGLVFLVVGIVVGHRPAVQQQQVVVVAQDQRPNVPQTQNRP